MSKIRNHLNTRNRNLKVALITDVRIKTSSFDNYKIRGGMKKESLGFKLQIKAKYNTFQFLNHMIQ